MLVYQRYIAKNVLISFVVTAFVITTIIWITQMLRFLYLLDKGIALIDFLKVIILIVPSLLYTILPFVALFAVIYIYYNLILDKQLVILKTSGLSNFKIALPTLFVIFVILILFYFLSLHLMPISYKKFQNKLLITKSIYSTNMIKAKEFTKIAKDTLLYTTHKDMDGTLQGIILFDNSNYQQIVLFAKYGKFKLIGNNVILELVDGMRQAYDHKLHLTKLHFTKLTVIVYNAENVKIGNYRRNIREYLINELLFPANEINQRAKNRLIIEGNQRLIWPLHVVVFPLLALSILLNAPYSKKDNFLPMLKIIGIIIIGTYIHFASLNIAIHNLNYICIAYINVIAISLFSIRLLCAT